MFGSIRSRIPVPAGHGAQFDYGGREGRLVMRQSRVARSGPGGAACACRGSVGCETQALLPLFRMRTGGENVKRRVFVNSLPLAVMPEAQALPGSVHFHRVTNHLTELRRVVWQHRAVSGVAAMRKRITVTFAVVETG